MPTRLACALPRTSSSGSTERSIRLSRSTDPQAALLWHRVAHFEVRHHIVIIC